MFLHGLKKSSGVMILFNKHFYIVIQHTEIHIEGRWIILRLIIEDKQMFD